MKSWHVVIEHIGTKNRYVVLVLASTLEEAQFKAGDWPYSNDGYWVIR